MQAGLGSAGPLVSGDYVALPNFITVSGTVGDSKVKRNDVVIATLVGTGVLNNLPDNVGGKAGNILRDVLGGQKPAPTAPNQPAPTKPVPVNPLDLFKPKK